MSRLFGVFSAKPVNLSCVQLSVSELASSPDRKMPIVADGWGIGFFRNNGSFLFKKASRLSGNQRIASIGEVISSNIFISHLRQATVGERKEANTQPFRWGNWLFAHQGTVNRFRKIRPQILRKLPSAYKKLIGGNTDSEHCFYFYLSLLRGEGGIKKGSIPIKAGIEGLIKWRGEIDNFHQNAEIQENSSFNLLISNGSYLLAARYGSPMYYLVLKGEDSDDTSFVSNETGLKYNILNTEKETQFVVVASEKLTDAPNWLEVPENHIIAIDSSLNIESLSWLPE